MAQKRNLFRRIRLVYRRSSPLLKCVVLACIILCTVALFVIRAAILDTRAEEERLRNYAAYLEQQNEQVAEDMAQLGTIEGIRQIAMRELGLVDPDAEFFIPTE